MGATMTGRPNQVAVAPAAPSQPQTAPAPAQAANVKKTWADIVALAIEQSKLGNGGRLNSARVCQPEIKACSNAIYYKLSDGKDYMLRTTEDINGNLQKREICSFNEFGDVRTCFNWDTAITSTDMKNIQGEWYGVDSK